MTEEFKVLYFGEKPIIVSNYGRIFYVEQHTNLIKEAEYHCDANGYVLLRKAGLPGYTRVHRLVAEAFCPNDDVVNKTSVDHIDCNIKNNRADNLRWTTQGDNLKNINTVVHMQQAKDNKILSYKKKDIAISNEQHDKLSESVKRGWETRRKNGKKIERIKFDEIVCVDLMTGKELSRFKTIKEASEKCGVSGGYIRSCCKNKRLYKVKFDFRYEIL